MVELLAPGVYPVETSFRAASIQGVGTSTTGFVGITRNGPRIGPPRLVTSFSEFERIYGGIGDLSIAGLNGAAATNYLAMAVRGYFNEGGSRLYISSAFLANGGDDGHAQTALVGASTGDARHLILRSRFPGSGADGTLQLSEIVTPATANALANAPPGTLARTRGVAALSASVLAVNPTGALADGMTLTFVVDGSPAVPITFNAGPAEARAADPIATNVDIPPGTVFTVTIDGLTQAVPLASGNGLTRVSVRDEITAGLTNGTCVLDADHLEIHSNASGQAVVVTVNQLAVLGFSDLTTTANGTGMRRLDGVNPADLNALLIAAGLAVTADVVPGTQLLRLSSNSVGNASSLDLSDPGNTAALTALGFDATDLVTNATVVQGQDGVPRRVFVRQNATPTGWQEYAVAGGQWNTTGGLVDASTQLDQQSHIASLSLAWESVDGVSTSYEGLGFAANHPRYFGHLMATVTDPIDEPLGAPLILQTGGLNGADIHAALFTNGTADQDDTLSAEIAVSGGDDGTVPALQNYTDAIDNLNLIEDIAIVAAPGSTAYNALGDAVRNALIGHAQNSNFRIAVCDPPPGQTMTQLRQTRGQFDNTYAAFYAPWIRVVNPLARPGNVSIRRELTLPPSGHICGIYARNDGNRGVHKTPANEIIREAVAFETDYNQRHQEVLNPIGINVLRHLTGRGNRVYGGRLATSDREVVYVSDRRYLNFLKHSIYSSMQWAVFEPNGPELWSDVREAVASFLFNQWRNGALLGGTPEVAFFVRCDRSVITQDDLDNGRLICEIGVAIVKPAEFLVFRIGQKTADSRD